jgi:hypothetical protein
VCKLDGASPCSDMAVPQAVLNKLVMPPSQAARREALTALSSTEARLAAYIADASAAEQSLRGEASERVQGLQRQVQELTVGETGAGVPPMRGVPWGLAASCPVPQSYSCKTDSTARIFKKRKGHSLLAQPGGFTCNHTLLDVA